MALANTITLDAGTGTRNPFTGALPANLQEHINNSALADAIVSFLFATTAQVRAYSSGQWRPVGGAVGTQPGLYEAEPGNPDPAFIAGDIILR